MRLTTKSPNCCSIEGWMTFKPQECPKTPPKNERCAPSQATAHCEATYGNTQDPKVPWS